MSTLQVANVWLESTANVRIYLPAANTIAVTSGGSNVFVSNTTTISIGSSVGNTTIGPGLFSPGYRLYVNGTIYATGDITALSDIAVKDNIMTITNALDTVSNLRGVSYDIKESGEHKIGLIAQEVKKVLPEVVVDAGGNIGIAYQNMVAVLIEAVKELKKRVEDLESR